MTSKITVGINGFGRIGRTLFRKLLLDPDIQVVAVNDIANLKTLAHLLKYDSIHGVLKTPFEVTSKGIEIAGNSVNFSSESELSNIPWPELDIVVECTGKFKNRHQLEKHLAQGAKKVILSVPPEEDDIKTVVLGVNSDIIDA
ncbi:MAG: glyceraldehyde 3-phosphate dehydrogenase NAD-binding domain-containing protein, partial [Marinirhabdus sp.]|nr:glyceraldehyde 3-phosphate dehydrogenase NAD-binding domain-containing protein [Marinirhabdus sp.]